MRIFSLTILGAASAALLLSACAGEQRRAAPERRTVARPPARALAGSAVSPAVYVAEAGAMDLFEVRSAELALQRSSSARIKEFAAMMIPAHRGSAAQLSLAGRRLNLLPSAVLSPKYQAMLTQLQSATDFDSLYRRQQVVVHQEALNLHSRFAARGASPTLRPVASAMVPVIERHLRLLRYL